MRTARRSSMLLLVLLALASCGLGSKDDQLVAENPDLVTRFLCATLKGWRTAIENPETAVTATLAYADGQYQDMQTEMFDAVVPLVHTGEDQIGWMRAEVWDGMYPLLAEQGLLDRPFDATAPYSMSLLASIYRETA